MRTPSMVFRPLGEPLLLFIAAHRDGAIIAVEVPAGKVQVGLHLTEIGEHLGEAPFVVAPGCPVVIVLRDPAEDHLTIDGAGTARHLAPGYDQASLLWGKSGGVFPRMGGIGGKTHNFSHP